MNKFAIRLLTLAMLSLTLVAAPVVTVVYAAPDNDPPPPDKSKKKKSSEVHPGTQQTAFADGYRAAYATIYDRHDYASAIEQLKALGRDDSAAVANLIGYSYRKLGDYKVSQIWYERALKADPNHVKTWQYYGLWQVEQGNRESAQYHLNKIASLTGTSSEEYRSLAAALEQPPGVQVSRLRYRIASAGLLQHYLAQQICAANQRDGCATLRSGFAARHVCARRRPRKAARQRSRLFIF